MINERYLLQQHGLSEITRIILENSSSKGELRQTVINYAAWLESINPVEKFRFDPVMPLILPSGKAIDPMNAAHCLIDYYRTVQFIRGLYEAVRTAQNRFSSSPIHVFYAGTGPYAALMLPLTTVFSPEEVQFTLVEAHPVTYDMLLQTIQKLELTPWIKNTICADACNIQLADTDPVQVFLTETMHAALKKEPQVSITRHFAPQLPSDVIFLPESIRVWAGLSNPKHNQTRIHSTDASAKFDHELGTVMELTRFSSITNGAADFPVVRILIPESLRYDYPQLSLYTDITILGEHTLKISESVLTIPVPVLHFEKANFTADFIDFQYFVDTEPGFSIVPATTPLSNI